MENGVSDEYIAVAKSFHKLSYLLNNKYTTMHDIAHWQQSVCSDVK